MEGMVPGVRGRGRPRRRWQQDIKETLNMTLDEAVDRYIFRRVCDESDVP
uniref:Uncharacterized protein n=1 Tax=Arion vulgaris TaxID=1028688 RepID=A0A0B7BT15_9EUPU